MISVVAALLLLQAPAVDPAPAPEPTLQVREGLYVGVGLGLGRVGFSCDGCAEEGGTLSTNAVLRMGVVMNPRLTVGLEIDTWKSQNNDDGAASFLLAANYYPSATGGHFLRAGVGTASFNGEQLADGVSETGGGTALMAGIGTDMRFDRNLALTPVVTFVYNDIGNSTLAGGPRRSGIRAWTVGFGVGFTWH